MWFLTGWNKYPECIQEDKVSPIVIGFRARIRYFVVIFLHHTRTIIQNISIDLTHGDNHLCWMAVWRLDDDHPSCQIAKWPPSKLQNMSDSKYYSQDNKSVHILLWLTPCKAQMALWSNIENLPEHIPSRAGQADLAYGALFCGCIQSSLPKSDVYTRLPRLGYFISSAHPRPTYITKIMGRLTEDKPPEQDLISTR